MPENLPREVVWSRDLADTLWHESLGYIPSFIVVYFLFALFLPPVKGEKYTYTSRLKTK